MDKSLQHLEQRTARLERTVRFVLFSIGACVVALALTAAAKPNILRARAFQLVSDDGDVKAELITRNGHPGLYLKDLNGTDRVSVFYEADASGLYVMDSEGVTRVGLAQFAHGGGGLALHGPKSKGAAVLYLKGTGRLRFFDADGIVTNQVLGTQQNESEVQHSNSPG